MRQVDDDAQNLHAFFFYFFPSMATNLLSVSGSWPPQQTLADPVPRSGRSRSRIGNMVRREANRSHNPLSHRKLQVPHSNDEPLKMGKGTKQSQEQMEETRDGLQDNEHWPGCKAIPFSAINYT
jgi:hypothetical protein